MNIREELEKRKFSNDATLVAGMVYGALPLDHPLRKSAFLLAMRTYGCTYNDVLGLIEYAEREGVLPQPAQPEGAGE